MLKWVIQQFKQDNTIWLLIPARTDTKRFRELVDECGEHMHLIFITGRLKFNDSKQGAPFPSVFVVLSKDVNRGQSFTIMTEEELIQDLKNYL